MRSFSRVSSMFVVLGAALAAPLLGAPETAQAQYVPYEYAPYRDRGVIRVDGVSPSRAVPGERITVHGAGFSAATQVFVGGQPVAIEWVRDDALIFLAPQHAGDGQVVLRDPRAPDTVVGALAITPPHEYGYPPGYVDPRARDPRYADPRYRDPRYADPRYADARYRDPHHADPRYADPRYDPRRRALAYPAPTFGRVDFAPHPRGVRIVVDGRGFSRGDTLLVGGVPAEVRSLEGHRMIAWAPRGVSGAVTWQCGHDGRRYDTGAVLPAGYGSDRRYEGAYYGARYGYGYDRLASARYAPYPTPYVESLHVQGRRGGELLVIVVGSGFGPDARVSIGHVAVPIVSRSDRQLVVAVPRGLHGALPLFIDSAGQRIASPTQLVLPR